MEKDVRAYLKNILKMQLNVHSDASINQRRPFYVSTSLFGNKGFITHQSNYELVILQTIRRGVAGIIRDVHVVPNQNKNDQYVGPYY